MATFQSMLSVIRCVVYVIIIICSFVIFCPLAVSMERNHCLLYSSFVDLVIVYGPKSVCTYSIAQAVIVCLAWPIIAFIVNILIVIGKLKITITNKVPSLILVVTDGVSVLLTLVSACTISVGLKTICDNFRQRSPDRPCFTNYIYFNKDQNDRDYFYGKLRASEIGGWMAFAFWLALLVLSVAGILWNRKYNITRKKRQIAQTLQLN